NSGDRRKTSNGQRCSRSANRPCHHAARRTQRRALPTRSREAAGPHLGNRIRERQSRTRPDTQARTGEEEQLGASVSTKEQWRELKTLYLTRTCRSSYLSR